MPDKHILVQWIISFQKQAWLLGGARERGCGEFYESPFWTGWNDWLWGGRVRCRGCVGEDKSKNGRWSPRWGWPCSDFPAGAWHDLGKEISSSWPIWEVILPANFTELLSQLLPALQGWFPSEIVFLLPGITGSLMGTLDPLVVSGSLWSHISACLA